MATPLGARPAAPHTCRPAMQVGCVVEQTISRMVGEEGRQTARIASPMAAARMGGDGGTACSASSIEDPTVVPSGGCAKVAKLKGPKHSAWLSIRAWTSASVGDGSRTCSESRCGRKDGTRSSPRAAVCAACTACTAWAASETDKLCCAIMTVKPSRSCRTSAQVGLRLATLVSPAASGCQPSMGQCRAGLHATPCRPLPAACASRSHAWTCVCLSACCCTDWPGIPALHRPLDQPLCAPLPPVGRRN